MKLYVSFLWHMHQPLYLDPERDHFIMPWVRLHAVKAYTDMVRCLDQIPGARVTFNLVPSLLVQIEAYNQGKSDIFLEVSEKSPKDLSPAEKDFLLRHFFSCHWPTMVEPYPRYRELLELRGRELNSNDLSDTREKFTDQDLLDLQVWFNLTWMGFSSKQDQVVRLLLKKGRGFTQEEKASLLNIQREILKQIIPEYKSRWQKGQIEISTTPFYHPILPLVVDTDLAKRCMPDAKLPARFSYPQDALTQLKMGRELCKKLLGRAPDGLWPSEGSVAPEIVPLASEAGFKWAATDEAILFNSLEEPKGQDLLQPYKITVQGQSINMVFRHHEISDLIGFVYHKNPSELGVRDFLARLRHLKDSINNQEQALLTIVLDGENPWEYYADGGEHLLSGIYQGIVDEPDMELIPIGEFLERFPPKRELSHLYTGSWINHDFAIWIGGQEENKAWEALGRARKTIDKVRQDEMRELDCQKALDAIYPAEGSDWFWWYGDKFVTDYAFEFDQLFRLHLQRVYKILGRPIPEELLVPIRGKRPVRPQEQPLSFISPVIDGQISSYWEWKGAGSVPLEDQGGAMHFREGELSKILFGFDLANLYIRMDLHGDQGFHLWDVDKALRIVITSQFTLTIDLFPKKLDNTIEWAPEVRRQEAHIPLDRSGIKVAAKNIMEVAVPFDLLEATPGQELQLHIETLSQGLVQDRWPRQGDIVMTVPDEDFERRHWLV